MIINKFCFYVGSGRYNITQNSVSLKGEGPSFKASKNGCVRVQHREYIGDISGSTSAFAIQSYLPINPGAAVTFPWLSTVAQSFQQYRFHGLVFEYISSSGNAISGTSAAIGEVFMATNYNANGTQFTTKSEMLNMEFATVSSPAQSLMHLIECDPKQSTLATLYVRNQSLITPDFRFYDLGDFTIATSGQPGTYAIGSLFVTYDVELFKPSMLAVSDPLVGNEGLYSRWVFGGNPNASAGACLFYGPSLQLTPVLASTYENSPIPSQNFPVTLSANGSYSNIFYVNFPPNTPAGTWLLNITGFMATSAPTSNVAYIGFTATHGAIANTLFTDGANGTVDVTGFTAPTPTDAVKTTSFAAFASFTTPATGASSVQFLTVTGVSLPFSTTVPFGTVILTQIPSVNF